MRQISLSLFCFVKHQKSLQCLFHFRIEGQKLDRVTNFFENDFRRKEMTFHTIGMALLYYYFYEVINVSK